MKFFLVGGAVRDALLRRGVKDRDYVVVGGTEKQLVEAGFECVGQGFPVFLHPETGEEYALARREKKVGTGYTGFEFETSADVTLEEDLSRRDLTINSMARDGDLLVDPFCGAQDLAFKLLRHTSDAFAEDPLRVVRLARFYARYHSLGFTVAPETMDLASRMVDRGDLNELPDERFWLEVEKALSDPEPQHFFELLFQLGALNKVEFFRTMFGGNVTGPWLSSVMKLAKATKSLRDTELQTDVFAAWVAPQATVNFFHTGRAGHLFTLYRDFNLLGSHPGPVEILTLFNRARAFGMGGRADDFLDGLRVWEDAHEVYASPYPADVLSKMLRAARAVTSEPFQHLEGREIGVQMAKARVAAIAAAT